MNRNEITNMSEEERVLQEAAADAVSAEAETEGENAESETEEEKAALEAAADAVSANTDGKGINESLSYIVPLSREYRIMDKIVKEVDLSGLEDLTTLDAQEIDRVMAKMNYSPRNKFRDTLYTKHLAMRATGLPVEFFNMLNIKDMEAITSRVAIYFLY